MTTLDADQPIPYTLTGADSAKYPVDSTYYPCCHSIGRHDRDCDTAPVAALTDPPVPAGAAMVTDWDELDTRNVFGPTHAVGDFQCHALAVQARSGAIVDDPAQEAPMVCVNPGDETTYSPAAAVDIGIALITAAIQARDWARQTGQRR